MGSPGQYIPENPEKRRRRGRGGEGRSERLAKLIRLIRAIARPAEAVWKAKDDLEDFLAELLGDEAATSLQDPSRIKRRIGATKKQSGRKTANNKLNASNVQIVRGRDGSANVTLVWSQELRLSPAMADLLEVLCSQDTGSTREQLVAWKPLAELMKRLREKTGKDLDPHTVTMRIHRLRSILDQCGVDKSLVQTDRQRGFRFAKQAKPPPEIGGNLR